jgi:hypothetical protein
MRKRRGQGKYPYFSNSRTGAYLSDHEIIIPQTAYTVTSPSLSGLPTVSRTTTATGSPTRATIARLIEKDLASGAVTRFNAPPKIHYAKGTSQLIFGEFRTLQEVRSGKPALIWTATDYDHDDRHSVAICLFGSMSNFTEYIQNAPPASTNSWSASSSPNVLAFLQSQAERNGRYAVSHDRLAMEALNIAVTQRSLGQVSGYADPAEWLAEIYLDVDLTSSPETGRKRSGDFRRILVGAPLWIRAHPGAIHLYADLKPPPDWARPGAWPAWETRSSPARGQLAGNTPGWQMPGDQVALPAVIFDHLVRGFMNGAADDVLAMKVNQQADGHIALRQLSSPLADVFAFILETDPGRATRFLAEYFITVRTQHEQWEIPGPPPRLTDTLNAARLALPDDLQEEYVFVAASARAEVRRYYGRDPDLGA